MQNEIQSINTVEDNPDLSDKPTTGDIVKRIWQGHDMDVHGLLVPKGKKLSLKSAQRERVVVLSQGSVAVLVDGDISKGFKVSAPAHFILPRGKLIEIITFDEVLCYGIGQRNQTVIPLNEEASNIEHFFTEGVYARKMVIPAGTQVPTHQHVYDHLSILAQGRVRVAIGPISQEYVAPAMIEIKKNVTHRITAVEDSVWFCIHATSATDVESLENSVIVKD